MKAGDVVQLASGGITMTIGRVYTVACSDNSGENSGTSRIEWASCYWTGVGQQYIECIDVPVAALKIAGKNTS